MTGLYRRHDTRKIQIEIGDGYKEKRKRLPSRSQEKKQYWAASRVSQFWFERCNINVDKNADKCNANLYQFIFRYDCRNKISFLLVRAYCIGLRWESFSEVLTKTVVNIPGQKGRTNSNCKRIKATYEIRLFRNRVTVRPRDGRPCGIRTEHAGTNRGKRNALGRE